jgi:hypothetical protein
MPPKPATAAIHVPASDAIYGDTAKVTSSNKAAERRLGAVRRNSSKVWRNGGGVARNADDRARGAALWTLPEDLALGLQF